MSIPKEPRQQMINMMYIVLTALLALNVSAEVLKSFDIMNTSIAATNETLGNKNASLMANFEMKFANNPVKTQAFYNDAMQVEQLTANFFQYVEQVKQQVIDASGGLTENGEIKKKKDTDATTLVLIEQGVGLELQTQINNLRNQLLLLPNLAPEDKLFLEKQLPLQTNYDKKQAAELGKRDWSAYNFEKVPVIAALALLTKIQGDARTSETMMLEMLYRKVDFDVFKFDKIMASSMNNSNYVIAGQEQYQANIFVAATSSTQEVEVFMGEFTNPAAMYDSAHNLLAIVDEFPLKAGYDTIAVKNGVAAFNELPNSVGNKHKTGVIKLREADGVGYRYLPFELNYKAANPGVVVSPDNMNVMYIGLENPISISVPGVPAEKVTAKIKGAGTITGSNGAFIGRVTTPGTVEVEVYADIDGQRKKMGTQEFRAKRVPAPLAQTLNKRGGPVNVGFLKAISTIDAVLDDFPFKAPFTVVSFTMQFEREGAIQQYNANNNRLTDDMKTVLKQAKPKDHVYFANIKVKGPDGRIFVVDDLIFVASL